MRGKILATLALAIVTLALVLFLVDLSTVDRSYVEYAAEASDDQRRASERYVRDTCFRLPAVEAEKCIDDAGKSAQDERREQYDLSAQRQTALWTKWMGIAALIGMTVSVVGVLLVWWTFRETRKQAGIAQQTYQAFIAVEDAALSVAFPEVRDVESGKQYSVTAAITNIGRTAAQIHLWKVDDRVKRVDQTLDKGGAPIPVRKISVPATDFEFIVEYSSAIRPLAILTTKARVKLGKASPTGQMPYVRVLDRTISFPDEK